MFTTRFGATAARPDPVPVRSSRLAATAATAATSTSRMRKRRRRARRFASAISGSNESPSREPQVVIALLSLAPAAVSNPARSARSVFGLARPGAGDAGETSRVGTVDYAAEHADEKTDGLVQDSRHGSELPGNGANYAYTRVPLSTSTTRSAAPSL